MRVLHLPCYGSSSLLGENGGRAIRSNLKPSDANSKSCRQPAFDGVLDGIESLILAAACAGVDVASPAFVQAIETALEAAANQT